MRRRQQEIIQKKKKRVSIIIDPSFVEGGAVVFKKDQIKELLCYRIIQERKLYECTRKTTGNPVCEIGTK